MHNGDAADAAADKKRFRIPNFQWYSEAIFFCTKGYCGILYLRRLFPRSSLQLTKHGLEWPWLAKQVHQMGRDTTCLSPATGQIMPTPNQVKEQALPLDCTSIATVGSKENKTGPRAWYSMIQPCGNLLQVIQVLGTKTAKTLSPRLLSPAVVARNLRQKPAPCILSCGYLWIVLHTGRHFRLCRRAEVRTIFTRVYIPSFRFILSWKFLTSKQQVGRQILAMHSFLF